MGDDPVQISVKIPTSLLERLDVYCKAQHHTRSEVIRMSVEEHINRAENPDLFAKKDLEEATKAILFRLTREDKEYRREINQIFIESLMEKSGKNSSRNKSWYSFDCTSLRTISSISEGSSVLSNNVHLFGISKTFSVLPVVYTVKDASIKTQNRCFKKWK